MREITYDWFFGVVPDGVSIIHAMGWWWRVAGQTVVSTINGPFATKLQAAASARMWLIPSDEDYDGEGA